MKILFVYSLYDIQSPDRPLQSPGQIQFGISYISSLLKKYGYNTKLLVLGSRFGRRNEIAVDESVINFKPNIICFTAVATEYDFIADVAKYVKHKYPGIYLIIGGPHVSLNPEVILQDDFDAVCIGEGEYPVYELATQLERGKSPSGIPNLWFKRNSVIEKNPTRPFLEDLDGLPFPDRDMWEPWIREQPGSIHSILLGRGCPFPCTYCCNHALKKVAKGIYVRQRSTWSIIEEIKGLHVRYPDKREIYLETETFTVNKKWALKLCDELERLNASLDRNLSFGVNIRVVSNANFDELFSACKKSNFSFINIGLESGSERVRREVLRRNYSNRDIVETVELAKKYGMRVAFFNIIGIPGETVADHRETVEINRKCQPTFHHTSIFFPYPGTDLHRICMTMGLLDKKLNTTMERSKAVLELPTFSKKAIQKSFTWFDYNVYVGFKPLYKILAKVLVTKFKSNRYLIYFYRRFILSGKFLRKIKMQLK